MVVSVGVLWCWIMDIKCSGYVDAFGGVEVEKMWFKSSVVMQWLPLGIILFLF